MNDLSWCGGFFDGEGSFSFAPKCPSVGIVNTNPIAVTKFFEVMKKNNVDFKISERSKPSKSSKKKRWDLYIYNKNNVINFLELMEKYIWGKRKQLFLIKKFYEVDIERYSDIVSEYHKTMMKYNQTSNILIVDKNKLFEKFGYELKEDDFELYDETNDKIEFDDFNDVDYLSGIIDAEGTVYINKRNVNNSYDRFIPSIGLVNTNKMIIKKCCSVLRNNDIGFHIQSRIGRNRIRWDVSVTGVKRVEKLSNLLKDRLIIKNRQIDMIHKYCSLRLEDVFQKNNFADSFKESIEVLNKEN